MRYLLALLFVFAVACDDGAEPDRCDDSDIRWCFSETCGNPHNCLMYGTGALCSCILVDGCMDYFKDEYWTTDSNPC